MHSIIFSFILIYKLSTPTGYLVGLKYILFHKQ